MLNVFGMGCVTLQNGGLFKIIVLERNETKAQRELQQGVNVIRQANTTERLMQREKLQLHHPVYDSTRNFDAYIHSLLSLFFVFSCISNKVEKRQMFDQKNIDTIYGLKKQKESAWAGNRTRIVT